MAQGDFTTLLVPAVKDDSETVDVVVHAQRVVLGSTGKEVVVPLHDGTMWFDTADMSQGLRVWIPYDENKALPEGRYVATGDTVITGWQDGQVFSKTPITLDLQVRTLAPADLAEG